jgi:hypothetical protein
MMNREGLTWPEWTRAAGIELRPCSFSETSEGQLAAFRQAWLDGEDPTEWRAALAAARKVIVTTTYGKEKRK